MTYIFDIDGTLVDSKKRHSILLKRLLDNLTNKKLVLNEEEYLGYKASGRSTKDYLHEVLGYDEAIARKIAEEWTSKIEDRELLLHDELYPETRLVLECLKEQTIIYLSARESKENLLEELERLEILQFADEVIVSSPKQSVNDKALKIKEIIHKYRSRVMVVGDTETDYFAAVNNRQPYYILNRGFRNKEYWKGLGVDTHSSLILLKDMRE